MDKLYISADIEGVCGIADWKETELSEAQGAWFRNEMTQEVAAACEGANFAGVKEIFVKDAHDSARSIDPSCLPENVRIMRGWTRNPQSMMAGLDSSFGGVLLVGYHSGAGTNGNPLSHTMSTQIITSTINGIDASEFLLNTYTAAALGVPVLFLSGDTMLCESARSLGCGIRTVAVSEGIGGASISIHPRLARERIKNAVAEAVSAVSSTIDQPGPPERATVDGGAAPGVAGGAAPGAVRVPLLPSRFVLKTRFKEHWQAYRASFFPGARAAGSHEVEFRSKNWDDVLVFMLFNY